MYSQKPISLPLSLFPAHLGGYRSAWAAVVRAFACAGPEDASPGPGQSACNLYVNGLPLHYTDYDVNVLFGQYGPIYSLSRRPPRSLDSASHQPE